MFSKGCLVADRYNDDENRTNHFTTILHSPKTTILYLVGYQDTTRFSQFHNNTSSNIGNQQLPRDIY